MGKIPNAGKRELNSHQRLRELCSILFRPTPSCASCGRLIAWSSVGDRGSQRYCGDVDPVTDVVIDVLCALWVCVQAYVRKPRIQVQFQERPNLDGEMSVSGLFVGIQGRVFRKLLQQNH